MSRLIGSNLSAVFILVLVAAGCNEDPAGGGSGGSSGTSGAGAGGTSGAGTGGTSGAGAGGTSGAGAGGTSGAGTGGTSGAGTGGTSGAGTGGTSGAGTGGTSGAGTGGTSGAGTGGTSGAGAGGTSGAGTGGTSGAGTGGAGGTTSNLGLSGLCSPSFVRTFESNVNPTGLQAEAVVDGTGQVVAQTGGPLSSVDPRKLHYLDSAGQTTNSIDLPFIDEGILDLEGVTAGGIYVGGYIGTHIPDFGSGPLNVEAQSDDGFLVRYSTAGTPEWALGLSRVWPYRLIATSGDGVLMIGRVVHATTFDGKPIVPGLLLAEYDSSGSVIWSRAFGTSSPDTLVGSRAPNGDILIAGRHGSSGSLDLDGTTVDGYFIARFDATGQTRWAATYATSYAIPWSISSDGAGATYFVGSGLTPSVLGMPVPSGSDFVVKVDDQGSGVWLLPFPNGGAPGALRAISWIGTGLLVSGGKHRWLVSQSGHVLETLNLVSPGYSFGQHTSVGTSGVTFGGNYNAQVTVPEGTLPYQYGSRPLYYVSYASRCP